MTRIATKNLKLSEAQQGANQMNNTFAKTNTRRERYPGSVAGCVSSLMKRKQKRKAISPPMGERIAKMSCIYCGTNGIHAPGCPKDAGNRIVEVHPRGEHVEMSNRDEDEYDFYPQSGEQVITLRLREWEDFSFSDDADLDN